MNKLTDLLLFVCPPLGIFLVLKSDSIRVQKKMILVTLGIVNLTLMITYYLTLE